MTTPARPGPLAVGAPVRIRAGRSFGHCRTPAYVRGRRGVVAAYLGRHRNPEELAYGGSGLPESELYRIEVAMPELWPHYAGPADDTLLVEIYGHWLTGPNGDTGR